MPHMNNSEFKKRRRRCCGQRRFAENAEKFRKIYNAPTKPLFYSLNLMFSNVPVAVAVVVFAGP
ncbi:unnamed protein product, partial [Pocillopora meandrina]